MPRRKNDYMSDGGSDSDASEPSGSDEEFNSDANEDSRAERRLFEQGSKRRKVARRGKEAAWEGIFGEGDGEGGRRARGLGARNGSGAGRTTKAPSFVPKSSAPAVQEVELQRGEDPEEESSREIESGKSDEDEDEDEDEDDEDEDEDEDDSDARPPSPRIRETDYDDEPVTRTGGIGSAKAVAPPPPVSGPSRGGRGGLGSSKRGGRGGIGSSRAAAEEGAESHGGLGSSRDTSHHVDEFSEDVKDSSRSAFGRKAPEPEPEAGPSDYARAQQSFKGRNGAVPAVGTKKVELTAQEKAHFNRIDKHYGIAAKMLGNMGWSAGEGLGKDRSGRAVPVEVGRVMRGQGIRSGTRTEDSKREARRRGEIVSDSEEEKPKRRGVKGSKPNRTEEDMGDSWKKQRKVKVKVEHKTYEQLLAEAGETQQVGLVIDARGGELKEVQGISSLSLSSWTPTSDATQLPELRHNLRLVVDEAKIHVDALAREGKAVNKKRRWALREEQLAKRRIDETTSRITRLERLTTTVATIAKLAAEEGSKTSPDLDSFTECFNTLIGDVEYRSLAMDEVIVGAISQVLRRQFADWQPFESSDKLLPALTRWKKAYNLKTEEQALVTDRVPSHSAEVVMTPWESLLWNVWLPKVRSAINNDWDARHPEKPVQLLEAWKPLLPPFVLDNVLDQLILPKVRSSIDEWDTRRSGGRSRSLATIVFPWLPLLGARIEEVLELAKRRIRHVLRKWVVSDGIPQELERWKKDIYSSKEWDELMLRNIVPKLGVCLRDDFSINPRKQDMVPLEDWVLPWHKLIRASTFCQLLEVNFFPKFLDTLYIWLIQPNRNGDEIASWFLWWKGRFPEPVLDMPGVQYGFKSALQLMDQASQLGVETPSKLAKPVFTPLPPKTSSSSRSKSKHTAISAAPQPTMDMEITFRSLAEDYATQNDLIFVPLGKSNASTGKPLFRVAKNVTGKGGITIYVGENAVFAQGDDGTFRAVSLEDMVKRASA
ncbi:GC-rich sequence DNA-binding factor-like protein-domain-containing protein [Kockovaella imperatae]|uniref:GC-rich sequence DNA-binding factor-like protein-domain-containing protein n=1 Tax=Kockovaella imperatae TaxID=4999 RepID=A0A1Y1ULY0_9TREE|nr:GC-rich sequence DNA-binding factor-like protein-domain-containing protein [Kockovaella imperatae]ORX39009.1 GC-rich sequence DNA-binding factor-like protein-domain-containing protein [Kockovaella imperatae]